MDDCVKKQIPLRDTYISATEPTNPYHGNYVVINLTEPYTLLLESSYTNLWQQQNSIWSVTTQTNSPPGATSSYAIQAPQWSDISRSFIMNTHTPRVWSNNSYWWSPGYYSTNGTTSTKNISRSARYPESQLGDTMYLRALLDGLGNLGTNFTYGPRYSTLFYGNNTGITYNAGATSPFGDPHWYYRASDTYASTDLSNSYTFPNFGGSAAYINIGTLAPEDVALNNYINYPGGSPVYGLNHVAGFNQTLFVVDAFVSSITPFKKCVLNTQSFLTINIRPLVPYSDLFSGFLYPPQDYYSYTKINGGYPDWNGNYDIESIGGTNIAGITLPYFPFQQISVLPQITANISPKAKCFFVTLPVQLYTLAQVGYNSPFDSVYAGVTIAARTDISGGLNSFTFTLNDVNSGCPVYYSVNNNAAGITYGNYANMSVAAITLKGTFKDVQDDPCAAVDADSIQFSIFSPTSPSLFSLSHTYEENTGGKNRPIYCTETGSIPIRKESSLLDLPYQTSLLFSPKCGPGIWSNLPSQVAQPGGSAGIGWTFNNIPWGATYWN